MERNWMRASYRSRLSVLDGQQPRPRRRPEPERLPLPEPPHGRLRTLGYVLALVALAGLGVALWAGRRILAVVVGWP